jgi:hypothetical protein
VIHSKTCNKQRNESGKCVCGQQPEIDRQKALTEVPAHIPADEVPIFNFMVKQGKRDSMSLYLDIKQMLNEIWQIKSPPWGAASNKDGAE